VGILVAGGWFLLRLLRFPRAWRYFLLIPAVGLYVLIGGLRVSLLRAAVMFGVVGIPRYFLDLGVVSACAQLGVLPFLASTFGYIASYGLLANLILIPWTTILVWAGILELPFLVFPQTGVWAGRVLAGICEPYLWAVEKLGNLPGAVLPVGEGFALWYLLALLSLLILRAAQEDFLFPLGHGLKPRRA
jgi:hypothetical protein